MDLFCNSRVNPDRNGIQGVELCRHQATRLAYRRSSRSSSSLLTVAWLALIFCWSARVRQESHSAGAPTMSASSAATA